MSSNVVRPSLSTKPGVDWHRPIATVLKYLTIFPNTKREDGKSHARGWESSFPPTFLQRSFLILLQTLDSDWLQSDSGRWILLQNIPHVILTQHEQVTVSNRPDAGCAAVPCFRLEFRSKILISDSNEKHNNNKQIFKSKYKIKSIFYQNSIMFDKCNLMRKTMQNGAI